jgi:hypothetical protein
MEETREVTDEYLDDEVYLIQTIQIIPYDL